MAAQTSKYALIERERKYIIAPDDDLIKRLPYKIITDLYVDNSGLRLRKVVDDSSTVYKLTKKRQANVVGESTITTIYLSEPEYDLLSVLTGVLVTKTRFIKTWGDLLIGIDQYKNDTDELWIAEIEFNDTKQMESFKMPMAYINEVTGDTKFNGYCLAKRFANK